jgi:hypothetical protein
VNIIDNIRNIGRQKQKLHQVFFLNRKRITKDGHKRLQEFCNIWDSNIVNQFK